MPGISPTFGISDVDGVSYNALTGVVSGERYVALVDRGSLHPSVSLTRAATAGTGYFLNYAGLLEAAGANLPRIEYDTTGRRLGFLVEGPRTNVCLRNRDLTNAAWTASNITAAKDQTGPDGVANSASSITATAGNGTILQSITLASSARAQSAYVKRLVGTGNVEMTMDNGATWTAVTVTSSWSRVRIPTQTLANPVVGFRIVTSGDSVAVDFVQNENGTFPSSVIATGAASVARPADVCTIASITSAIGFSLTAGTILATVSLPWLETPTAITSRRALSIDDGTVNNRYLLVLAAGSDDVDAQLATGGVSQFNIDGSAISENTPFKLAVGYTTNDAAYYIAGTQRGTDASVSLPTVTTIRIGNDPTGAYWYGHIDTLLYCDSRNANGVLASASS